MFRTSKLYKNGIKTLKKQLRNFKNGLNHETNLSGRHPMRVNIRHAEKNLIHIILAMKGLHCRMHSKVDSQKSRYSNLNILFCCIFTSWSSSLGVWRLFLYLDCLLFMNGISCSPTFPYIYVPKQVRYQRIYTIFSLSQCQRQWYIADLV